MGEKEIKIKNKIDDLESEIFKKTRYYGVYELTKNDGTIEYLVEFIQISPKNYFKIMAREKLKKKLDKLHGEGAFKILEIFKDLSKADAYQMILQWTFKEKKMMNRVS